MTTIVESNQPTSPSQASSPNNSPAVSEDSQSNAADTPASSQGNLTVTPAGDTFGQHSNAIVPHKISNHDVALQFSMWANGQWININDTLDQKNVLKDLHKVHNAVTNAQKDIINAQNTADSAVKSAESAISASKVNSDAISDANAAIKTAASGADAAMSQANVAISDAASAANSLRSSINDVQKDVNSNQAVNDSASKAMQSSITSAQSDINQVSAQLNKTSASLDQYAQSAAEQGHDITALKSQAGQLETDLADTKGNVNQLISTTKGLQGNIKDNAGNIAKLSAAASEASVAISNAQSQVAQLQVTASAYRQTFVDQAKRISNVEVTASAATVEASAANSTATQAQLTASNAGVAAKDAQSNVLAANATASAAKIVATNASSQAAEAELTANQVTVRISGVEKATSNAAQQASQAVTTANGASAKADSNAQSLQKVVTQVTTNTTNLTATQKALQAKADQTTVNNVKGTLTNLSGQVSVVAGEVKSKADQTTVTNLSNSIDSIKNNTQWKIASGVLDANNLKTTQRIFYQDTQAKNTPNAGWFYLLVDAPRNDRITQTLIRDNSTDTWTRVWNGQWSGWNKVASSNDISNLQAQIIKNSTSISNNANAINLKADKSVTDALNKTVQQQSAQQTTMANEIKSKITQAQLTDYVNGKGFATETYAQNLVNQTAHTWSLNLSELTKKVNDNQSTNTTRSTQLQASVDGLQGTVNNFKNDMSSRFDQLDNTFSTKVWKTLDDNSKKQAAIVENSDRIDLNTMTTAGKYLLTGELINSPFSEVSDPVSSASSTSSAAAPANSAATSVQPASSAGSTSNAPVSSVSSSAAPTQPVKHTIPANVILLVTGIIKDGSLTQKIYLFGSDGYYSRKETNWHSNSDGKEGVDYWSKWTSNKSDESSITQMQNDINFKVSGNGLMSQINLEAGRMLFDSDKIYLNAKSVVFGKDATAFIPSALITDLSADKITTGTLDAAKIHVKNFNAESIAAGTLSGIDIQSSDKSGNKYEMIGPNLYWIGEHSQARMGQPTKDNSLLQINSYDDSNYASLHGRDLLGDSQSYTILGSPNIAIATAGAWDEKDKYTVNSPAEYPKILLKGWMSDYNASQPDYGPGAYITAGDTTLKLNGAFQPVNKGESSYPTPLSNQSKNSFYLTGWNGVTFDFNHLNNGGSNGDYQKNAQFTIQKDNKFSAWFGQGDNGNVITFVTAGDGGAFNVNTSFFVHGSKNAVVPTTQGTVAVNAYETAGYYFGDIGEDQTGDTKKKWVSIDYVFGQTVNTSVPYQVFITPYSSAHVWVSKRLKNRFLVESDQPNAAFAWEIKAKRKGYENVRLSNVDKIIKQPAGVK